MRFSVAALLFGISSADVPGDLVQQVPGFDATPFKVYSGLLDVPGPVSEYDSLKIHYQFHTSQRDPATDPVATWHQGGPGGSSINVGLYGEMGYFQITTDGPKVNDFAWNKVANMLYFESPAGSGEGSGFSQCFKGGKKVTCHWDDKTQGEAYAHTLAAFFDSFPEFASNSLYLTGESYFGQYGPNIAHFILNNAPFNTTLNLKGLALGNACSDGDDTHVTCLDNEEKVDVELYYGKGLFSPKLYQKINKDCDFSDSNAMSLQCTKDLLEMRRQVGPHNVYNIYDNCPDTSAFLERTGKDMKWLTSFLRKNLHRSSAAHNELKDMNGGFDWNCNGDIDAWIKQPEVMKALHLEGESGSGFRYTQSGPASIMLYPELVTKLRILIFNGDADACVPYIANENWIARLESAEHVQEAEPWTPWFTSNKAAPAGYITKYDVPNKVPGREVSFAFQTIRLAGHMVPQFQPEAALVLISDFLAGDSHAVTV
jgi:carboxypeptidase C (cathepsin A)